MSKYSAFDTILSMGAPGSAVEIASVKSISGPGLSLDTEDVTTHDSDGAWEDATPTLLHGGEISLDLIYDPAEDTHDATTGLIAAMKAKTLEQFALTFPDGAATTWNMSGYVTGFEPSAPVEGALTATAKIKVSGEPTLA